MKNNKNFRIPGQLVKSLINDRGWTQRLSAIILGMDETKLNKIITGKTPVTAETAILFGEIFDTPAEEFLELQKEFDLALARIVTMPDPSRSTRAHLFAGLPVTEMIRRGWLDADDIRDIPSVEASLAKFFCVNSIDEIEILPHAAKKTNTYTPITPPQLAWFYRVKEIATEMIVAKYSPATLRNALTRLNNRF